MGSVAFEMRKISLLSERADVERKITTIIDSKSDLTRSLDDLVNVGTDLEPNSPVVAKLRERQQRIQLLEKKLDMQLERLRNRLKKIDVEEQSCDQMLQSKIKRDYSYAT